MKNKANLFFVFFSLVLYFYCLSLPTNFIAEGDNLSGYDTILRGLAWWFISAVLLVPLFMASPAAIVINFALFANITYFAVLMYISVHNRSPQKTDVTAARVVALVCLAHASLPVFFIGKKYRLYDQDTIVSLNISNITWWLTIASACIYLLMLTLVHSNKQEKAKQKGFSTAHLFNSFVDVVKEVSKASVTTQINLSPFAWVITAIIIIFTLFMLWTTGVLGMFLIGLGFN
jgi:hypothetical protein